METQRISRTDWGPGRFALSFWASFILCGFVLSLLAAAREIYVQEYLPLGYHRLALLVARETANRWVVRSAFIGAGLACLAVLFPRWRVTRGIWLLLRSIAGFGGWKRWVLLAAGGVLAGILSGIRALLAAHFAGISALASHYRAAAIFATVTVSAVASVLAFILWRRRLAGDDPERLAGVMVAIWISVGLTTLAANVISYLCLPVMLFSRSPAAGVGFTLAFFVLVGPVYWLQKPLRAVVRIAGRNRRVLGAACVGAGIALIGTLVLNVSVPEAAASQKPDILLISVDTLRADHLSCYGYGRKTSPAIDRLAKRGIRFENAISASTWTLPSHATILTGLFPSTHGAIQPDDRLRPETCLLSETLRENGYRTGAVVTGTFVTSVFGFRQGFEFFDESRAASSMGRTTSPHVTDTALDWLRSLGQDRFFLFVHYFDPHSAYLYHPEFDYYPDYKGAFGGSESFTELLARRKEMSPDDVKKIVALYDGEINVTDREIGRLLTGVRNLGRQNNLLVILTADHGEEFMERGWIGHRIHLYDFIVRVPVIVTWESRIAPNQTASVPISQVDLAPFVLESAGIASPSQHQTDSLWKLLGIDPAASSGPAVIRNDSESGRDRAVFSEVSYDAGPGSDPEGRAYKTAIRTRQWKFIHDEMKDKYEIYNLVSDPSETHNLNDATGEFPLPELRSDWVSLSTKAGRVPFLPSAPGHPTLTKSQRERLKSIGYF